MAPGQDQDTGGQGRKEEKETPGGGVGVCGRKVLAGIQDTVVDIVDGKRDEQGKCSNGWLCEEKSKMQVVNQEDRAVGLKNMIPEISEQATKLATEQVTEQPIEPSVGKITEYS